MTDLHCEKCQRTRSQMSCHLDVYNDFDDSPGNLICDDCVDAEARECAGSALNVVMPARPEGYYHCAPGTFE